VRKHHYVRVDEVKRGDVIIKTDNSKWTVSEVNVMAKSLAYYYILARNGSKLERWEYMKASAKIRKQTL
jgi:hypothetical protein